MRTSVRPWVASRFRRAIGRGLAILQLLLSLYYAVGFGVKRHWLAAIAWSDGAG